MSTNFKDVQEFHDKFGLMPVRPILPHLLEPALLRFRLGFLIEELAEYADATGAYEVAAMLHQLAMRARICDVSPLHKPVSLANAFDSLIDLSVVTLGTADLQGFPWQDGWIEVHRANMAKERAAADGSNSKRGSSFDVVKPKGWIPPDIDGLLKQVIADLSRA